MITYDTTGVVKSPYDLRDYKVVAGTAYPDCFMLKDMPKIKNQGCVGSCVAHAVSSILEWLNKKETSEYRELSTGFVYGMQDVLCGRKARGMRLRDACKIVKQCGDCLHETIPFNIEMPEASDRLQAYLTDEVYAEAAICKVDSYARCTTPEAVKEALMTTGPVLASVEWYSKYSLDECSVIYFDKSSKKSYHAIMVYGFTPDGWLCQNSWGKDWGDNGTFIIPYAYGLDDAWSFVDAENTGVHKPKRNKWLDLLYAVLNFIINIYKGVVDGR